MKCLTKRHLLGWILITVSLLAVGFGAYKIGALIPFLLIITGILLFVMLIIGFTLLTDDL